MACDEISKAIDWCRSSRPPDAVRAVHGYLTIHTGWTGEHPPDLRRRDVIWYAVGELTVADSPTTHLVGKLRNVEISSRNGPMNRQGALGVTVEVFPDGTLIYQRLLHGEPIGGVPPATLAATCVARDVLTAVDGRRVITICVARAPETKIGP